MDKDPLLPAGEHSFPFDCKLPLELPSSFEGQFGRVRYLAKAVIERATWKSNVVCKRAFTVLSGLDLNFIPESAVRLAVNLNASCLVKPGLVLSGLVLSGLGLSGLVLFGLFLFGLVWFGIVWFGLVCFGLVFSCLDRKST